jgi:hypothetical protein
MYLVPTGKDKCGHSVDNVQQRLYSLRQVDEKQGDFCLQDEHVRYPAVCVKVEGGEDTNIT